MIRYPCTGHASGRSEALTHSEPNRAGLERMHMPVSDTRGGLPRQPVDVPEFGRVRVNVENVVETEPGGPATVERVAEVPVPFTVAGSLDDVVGGQRKRAQIPVFQTAAPAAEILDVSRARPGRKGGIRQIFPDVPGTVVIGSLEACVIGRVAAVEFEPS